MDKDDSEQYIDNLRHQIALMSEMQKVSNFIVIVVTCDDNGISFYFLFLQNDSLCYRNPYGIHYYLNVHLIKYFGSLSA